MAKCSKCRNKAQDGLDYCVACACNKKRSDKVARIKRWRQKRIEIGWCVYCPASNLQPARKGLQTCWACATKRAAAKVEAYQSKMGGKKGTK